MGVCQWSAVTVCAKLLYPTQQTFSLEIIGKPKPPIPIRQHRPIYQLLFVFGGKERPTLYFAPVEWPPFIAIMILWSRPCKNDWGSTKPQWNNFGVKQELSLTSPIVYRINFRQSHFSDFYFHQCFNWAKTKLLITCRPMYYYYTI